MNQDEAFEILKQAFSCLTDEEVSNFEHHLKVETPVLCQNKWGVYIDYLGGG